MYVADNRNSKFKFIPSDLQSSKQNVDELIIQTLMYTPQKPSTEDMSNNTDY